MSASNNQSHDPFDQELLALIEFSPGVFVVGLTNTPQDDADATQYLGEGNNGVADLIEFYQCNGAERAASMMFGLAVVFSKYLTEEYTAKLYGPFSNGEEGSTLLEDQFTLRDIVKGCYPSMIIDVNIPGGEFLELFTRAVEHVGLVYDEGGNGKYTERNGNSHDTSGTFTHVLHNDYSDYMRELERELDEL